MDAYKKLGAWIGSHMPVIAPVCVVVGVLLPDVFAPLKPLVPTMFAVMTFQGSLANRFRSIGEVFLHPVGILAVLVTTTVLLPCAAYALGMLFFGYDPDIVTGIVLEYSVPIAVVCIMWIEICGGSQPQGLALVLISTLLAPFSIPAVLKVLMGATIRVDVVSMMEQMLYMIAIPALLGVIVNDASRGWGKRVLSPAIGPFARVLLVLIITTNAGQMAPYLASVTPETFGIAAFMLLFGAFGFVAGLLLARLLRQDGAMRVTTTYACGLRNISAGAVIAASFFPAATVFPVMMGTLFQEVLAGLFSKYLEKTGGKAA